VQDRLSWFLDRVLIDQERENVAAHVESCSACSARLQSLEKMRAALKRMEKPPISSALAMRLRVLASHERQRQLSHVSLAAWFHYCRERAELLFDNLMRPMALPFAGGLLSALLLFSMLVPNLSFRHNFRDDQQLSIASEPGGRLVESLPADGAPTWLWTQSSVRLESVDAAAGSGDETVLELTIDDTGRVADYSVSSGQLTPEMQTLIMWSRFTPATFNGRSTWGKTRIVFSSHRRRNVRG
jgi:hypothetical protein